MIEKCIQHIVKEYLFLLQDLLKPLRTKLKNMWIQYIKVRILINYLIVHEYSNTYHSAIKMKPADVKSSTYIDFNIENND